MTFDPNSVAPSQVPRQRILWSATVGLDRSTREYIDAAAAAGLTEVSVHADRLLRREGDIAARRATARYAMSQGVTISVLDGINSWVPPADAALATATCSLEDALELASSLGASPERAGRFVSESAAAVAGAVESMHHDRPSSTPR